MIVLMAIIAVLILFLCSIELSEKDSGYSLLSCFLTTLFYLAAFHELEVRCQFKYNVADCYFDENELAFLPVVEEG